MNLSDMYTKCVPQALFQAFREALGFMLNDLRLSVLVSEKPKAPDDDESESLRDLEGRPVLRESVRKGRRCVLCDELIASDDASVSAAVDGSKGFSVSGVILTKAMSDSEDEDRRSRREARETESKDPAKETKEAGERKKKKRRKNKKEKPAEESRAEDPEEPPTPPPKPPVKKPPVKKPVPKPQVAQVKKDHLKEKPIQRRAKRKEEKEKARERTRAKERRARRARERKLQAHRSLEAVLPNLLLHPQDGRIPHEEWFPFMGWERVPSQNWICPAQALQRGAPRN